MKMMILAALTALSLGTGITNAYAFTYAFPQSSQHAGSYDNTGNGPQQSGLEGGGG
jgi:hypothetical protein